MAISSVGTALDLISKTSKALDSVREQAKTSKDATLKANISKLYDDFLDLKAVILRLTEEVNEMKAAQQKPKMVYRDPFFYQEGDATPFCPACYQGKEQRAVRLSKNADGWDCCICKYTLFTADNDPDTPAFGTAY